MPLCLPKAIEVRTQTLHLPKNQVLHLRNQDSPLKLGMELAVFSQSLRKSIYIHDEG